MKFVLENYEHIAALITRHNNGQLSVTEQSELDAWINLSPGNKVLFEELTDPDILRLHLKGLQISDTEAIWIKIKEHIPAQTKVVHRVHFLKTSRIWWAAACLLIALTAGYFIFFDQKKDPKETIVKVKKDNDVLAPAITKAMIRLSDGRSIPVDSLTQLKMGNVQLTKNANGEVIYAGTNNVVEYNTLVNPKGSKVQTITLADGTKVWMNAESTLKYFTSVGKGERKVEITGECYFEVAASPNPSAGGALRPFIVKDVAKNTEVQVLGTHFNVNTYSDEPVIKVTLLEGSVKVTKGNSTGILKPGQQAQVTSDVKVVNGVDIEAIMAWKNGFFSFNNTDLPTVMRQISRWYDVEIKFEGKIPDMRFGGEISTTSTAAQVLKILEKSKVKFRIEGKVIYVLQ
ncbi:MAG TPA: FecR domain-containing protein [Chitinophagaceae bacterium]|jgi:hypothetical protein|nr:FecR domain-containing protein [Chitinophagaceae bacterium]